VQVLKKCDNWERRTGYSEKKKVKTKFIDLDAGNDKLLNRFLLSLGCWLMLARRFCVYNAGAAQEILAVIMMSNDENVCSCKRRTVVRHVFCFWRSLCPFLASRLTTVSLDKSLIITATIDLKVMTITHHHHCSLQWQHFSWSSFNTNSM